MTSGARRKGGGRTPSGRGGRRCGIRWTDRALRDLAGIGEYIAQHDPLAASRWVSRLLRAVEDAALLPRAGRPLPEVGRRDVREVLRGNYRIVYRVGDHEIEVLTVFEGHRLLPHDAVPDDG